MYITKTDEAKIHPVLTELAIAYPQDGLVAQELVPVLNVGDENEDGYVFKFDKSNIQGGYEDVRAYGEQAGSFDWTLSTLTYHCEEHILEKPIDWREFKKFKKYLDIAVSTQEVMLEILLSNWDVRIATLLTTTANYASSSYYTALSGTTCWSDFVNSDPEEAVETAREVVALGSVEPNTIVVPVNVWRTLRRHPAIRALMKESDSRQLTDDGFPKKLFGLNAVFPGGRKNSAMPGATESISRIWSDYVWIGVVNKRPNKRACSFAYTIQADTMKVESYEDKKRKSDVVRIQHQISDEKIVCDTAGFLYSNVIA